MGPDFLAVSSCCLEAEGQMIPEERLKAAIRLDDVTRDGRIFFLPSSLYGRSKDAHDFAKELLEARALLKEHQWGNCCECTEDHCPSCLFGRDEGHTPDCKLAALIGNQNED